MNENELHKLLMEKVEETQKLLDISTTDAAMNVLFNEMSALIAAVGGLSQIVAAQAKKIEELETEIATVRDYCEHEIEDLRFDTGV